MNCLILKASLNLSYTYLQFCLFDFDAILLFIVHARFLNVELSKAMLYNIYLQNYGISRKSPFYFWLFGIFVHLTIPPSVCTFLMYAVAPLGAVWCCTVCAPSMCRQNFGAFIYLKVLAHWTTTLNLSLFLAIIFQFLASMQSINLLVSLSCSMKSSTCPDEFSDQVLCALRISGTFVMGLVWIHNLITWYIYPWCYVVGRWSINTK